MRISQSEKPSLPPHHEEISGLLRDQNGSLRNFIAEAVEAEKYSWEEVASSLIAMFHEDPYYFTEDEALRTLRLGIETKPELSSQVLTGINDYLCSDDSGGVTAEKCMLFMANYEQGHKALVRMISEKDLSYSLENMVEGFIAKCPDKSKVLTYKIALLQNPETITYQLQEDIISYGKEALIPVLSKIGKKKGASTELAHVACVLAAQHLEQSVPYLIGRYEAATYDERIALVDVMSHLNGSPQAAQFLVSNLFSLGEAILSIEDKRDTAHTDNQEKEEDTTRQRQSMWGRLTSLSWHGFGAIGKETGQNSDTPSKENRKPLSERSETDKLMFLLARNAETLEMVCTDGLAAPIIFGSRIQFQRDNNILSEVNSSLDRVISLLEDLEHVLEENEFGFRTRDAIKDVFECLLTDEPDLQSAHQLQRSFFEHSAPIQKMILSAFTDAISKLSHEINKHDEKLDPDIEEDSFILSESESDPRYDRDGAFRQRAALEKLAPSMVFSDLINEENAGKALQLAGLTHGREKQVIEMAHKYGLSCSCQWVPMTALYLLDEHAPDSDELKELVTTYLSKPGDYHYQVYEAALRSISENKELQSGEALDQLLQQILTPHSNWHRQASLDTLKKFDPGLTLLPATGSS